MNKRILIGIGLAALTAALLYGFSNSRKEAPLPPDGSAIHWISIEEAAKLAKQDRKKILIDVYTDWCGWCKRMDVTTYRHPELIKYINEHYHAVKLDAEQRENITINGHTYAWRSGGRNGYNEFAANILNGEMAFPTTVFAYPGMDTLIAAVPGYLDGDEMYTYARFFGEDAYQKQSLDEFRKANPAPKK